MMEQETKMYESVAGDVFFELDEIENITEKTDSEVITITKQCTMIYTIVCC